MQVNLSLTTETKDALNEIASYMHCSSLSQTVTRLIWEKKRHFEYDPEDAELINEDIAKEIENLNPDSSEADSLMFDVLAFVLKAMPVINMLTEAFRQGYVYSWDDYRKLGTTGELPEEAYKTKFVYMNRYDTSIEPGSIIINDKFDIVSIQAVDIKGYEYLQPWHISDDITIQADYEPIDEEYNDNYNVSGFSLIYKKEKCICFRYNPEKEAFDISIFRN